MTHNSLKGSGSFMRRMLVPLSKPINELTVLPHLHTLSIQDSTLYDASELTIRYTLRNAVSHRPPTLRTLRVYEDIQDLEFYRDHVANVEALPLTANLQKARDEKKTADARTRWWNETQTRLCGDRRDLYFACFLNMRRQNEEEVRDMAALEALLGQFEQAMADSPFAAQMHEPFPNADGHA